MCWKLLGMAMSVALEIGVFEKDSSRHSKAMPDRLTDIYEQRRLHVKSLLLVYITQTSGRLGVAAMLPDGYAVPALSELFTPSQETIKDIRDVVVHLWLQLACLVKLANEKLYANRHRTREIIRSGEYKTLLRQINPMLIEWRRQLNHYHDTGAYSVYMRVFDVTDFHLVPRQMYHIMMIEYEHSRVCVNQLSLQAVIERCINNTGNEGEPGKAIPPDRLNQWYGDDREIVGTVIESCRNVLKIAVDGLAPGGFLKHAPVRTSFRLISVAIVLVKVNSFQSRSSSEPSLLIDFYRHLLLALTPKNWPSHLTFCGGPSLLCVKMSSMTTISPTALLSTLLSLLRTHQRVSGGFQVPAKGTVAEGALAAVAPSAKATHRSPCTLRTVIHRTTDGCETVRQPTNSGRPME